MNCKQIEELLPLYAGRDLEEKRATLVTEHIKTCAACARVAAEYREFVQLTEAFAPPIFSEAVAAGIRQRVLREIETEAMAPAWSQTVVNLFRPRFTWAIASALLIVASMFAVYFILNRGNDRPQWTKLPDKVQSATAERSASEPRDRKRADLPTSVTTGGKNQLAGVPQPQRKRSRDTFIANRSKTVDAKTSEAMSVANNVSAQPSHVPEPTLFPPRESEAQGKTLRVELQTKDPKIRIIWFVQQETKPVILNSKGT